MLGFHTRHFPWINACNLQYPCKVRIVSFLLFSSRLTKRLGKHAQGGIANKSKDWNLTEVCLNAIYTGKHQDEIIISLSISRNRKEDINIYWILTGCQVILRMMIFFFLWFDLRGAQLHFQNHTSSVRPNQDLNSGVSTYLYMSHLNIIQFIWTYSMLPVLVDTQAKSLPRNILYMKTAIFSNYVLIFPFLHCGRASGFLFLLSSGLVWTWALMWEAKGICKGQWKRRVFDQWDLEGGGGLDSQTQPLTRIYFKWDF